MSRRTERIASLIRHIVADAIQNRLNDPRIERFTSVTRVEVSADLSLAKVHVSVMARDARRKLTLTALRGAARRIRGMLGEQLTTRQVPRVEFLLDDSLRRGFEMVQAIDELVGPGHPTPDQAEPADFAADSPPPAAPAVETAESRGQKEEDA